MAEFAPLEFLRSRRNTKWARYGEDVLPAWVADMDFEAAPPIQAALRRLVDEQDYGYADRGGAAAERAVAAVFSGRQRALYGWEPDPELVVPLPDLVQAVLANVLAFTGRDDGVLLQLPAYPPFIEAIEAAPRRLVANPMLDGPGGWRLDLERLEDDAGSARLLLVCNPQNPTGRVFSRAELAELGRIALEHDLIVVCDEVHAELAYCGHEHIPLATLAPEIAARTVTISSATKSFNIAGLRCAVMHFGSAELYDRFRDSFPDRLLGQLGITGIDATIAAWCEGDAWLDAVRDRLAANRALVTGVLRSRLPQVVYHEPEATYLAWLDLSSLDVRPSPWQYLLDEARVATTPGREFGPAYGDFVRLNFATYEPLLEEILRRVADALERPGERR